MIVDLKKMAFATLGKNLEKDLNTKEVKTAIRNGNVAYKFTSYCDVKPSAHSFTHYMKDGKEIEIDKDAIIKNYCKRNGITEVKETVEGYTITFKPTQKAIDEYNALLDNYCNNN